MACAENRFSLSQFRLIKLILALSVTLSTAIAIVPVMRLQGSTATSDTSASFAGTWHWMFNGKSFATMNLVRSGSGFTGSVTGSRIALNDDGALRMADPAEDATPKPITKAVLEGAALQITVKDGFEFTVTLKDSTHAEIHPKGAPANMKPIPAEKVR